METVKPMRKETEDMILVYVIIAIIIAYLLGTIVQALSNLSVVVLQYHF